jgi:GrpB-like predicted nucleotidyltransferase (UPF0157 family)/GNAT superfamily N-acetyltransferase
MAQVVIFTPYDPEWPNLFEKEATRIKAALGSNCIEIHHIGSTSIPGLSAKPIIDMLPVVRNILKVNSADMEALGHKSRGELGMPFRRYFSNGAFHIHIWEEGADEIQKQLLFRDYMRTHPEDRIAYQKLKEYLSEKFREDRPIYTAKKDPFIKNILRKTEFNGFEFVQPALEEDWYHYHRIRKEQIFDRHSHVIYDLNHWTITHPAHFHFILKKLETVIGVVHVELLDEQRAALRPFAIDKLYQNQGYGTYLLKLIERWVVHQGRNILQLHANPRALTFYQRAGYKQHPFEEGEKDQLTKNCVDLLKNLHS